MIDAMKETDFEIGDFPVISCDFPLPDGVLMIMTPMNEKGDPQLHKAVVICDDMEEG